MANASNIRLEPCDVSVGTYQQSKVTCAADIASSHNNDYFVLKSALNGRLYHVWYNVGGAGVDPAPGGGSIGIPVAIGVGATAAQVATATAAAIQAVKDFFAKVNENASAEVIIDLAQPGLADTPAAGVGLVGFAYALITAGELTDLGFLQGDIEVEFEESTLDITAHQTGVDVLAALRQGRVSSVSLVIQETHKANMELIFKQGGSAYTPPSGTAVVGWGSKTNAQNILGQSRKLILHPHALATSDRSRDLAFWLAYLNPDSINFSGENPLVVECSFKTFSDPRRAPEVDLFVFGDHDQDFKKP